MMQFAQASVVLDNADRTVSSNGPIVRLSISTVGIFSGDYELNLTGTEIGQDSDFILPGGGSFVPNITNGRLRVVPEPNACVVAHTFLASLMMRRRVFPVGHRSTRLSPQPKGF
jgi:hypothetical protein